MARELVLAAIAVAYVAALPPHASGNALEPGPMFELPDVSAPINPERLRNFRPFSTSQTSQIRLSGRGQICVLSSNGTPSAPLYPFGTSHQGPIDFSFGSSDGGSIPDVLIAGSADASTLPITLFRLENPPVRLGEAPSPFADGGLRSAIGNMFGDRTSELVLASGPGPESAIIIVPFNVDDEFMFDPFPGYNRGTFVATADVDGDGYDEVLASQEGGGEAKVFQVMGDQVRLIGGGRPFGHAYNEGVRLIGEDLNNDGKDELIAAPVNGMWHVRIYDLSGPSPEVVADIPAFERARPGGISVAAGYDAGKVFLIATSGPEVRRFDLTAEGGFRRMAFEENPFRIFIDIFTSVDTFTPPRSAPQ